MNILSSQIQRHREGPIPVAIQYLGGRGPSLRSVSVENAQIDYFVTMFLAMMEEVK